MSIQVYVLLCFISLALVVADTDDRVLPYQYPPQPRPQFYYWLESHRAILVVVVIAAVIVVVACALLCICFHHGWTVQPETLPPVEPETLAPVAAVVPRTLDIELFQMSSYSVESGLPFGDTDCHMCLMELVEGERLRTFPCRHTYHEDCIHRFLAFGHVACPECRMDLSASTSS